MKKLLNLMMIILLVTIAGCTSDDNEGTFELPTNSVGTGGETSSGIKDIGSTEITSDNMEDIALSVNGVAAGIRIIEPATIVLIDNAGSNDSTNVDSHGNFSIVGQSFTAPYVLFLVPGSSSNLNWQGDVQISIVVNTTKGNIVVNPITTAVALSIFSENGFDLISFAESVQANSADESLISQYNSILANITEEQLSSTLNSILSTWGTSSTGASTFSSNIFDSMYTPRSSMRQVASASHLLIETLGVAFSDINLGQNIADYNGNGSNLLLDKGFQEGLVFVLYSLNKYQPFGNFTVSSLLDQWITTSIITLSYETSLQLIVDELLEEEIGYDKSDAEIKAIIKTIIASENITF